MKSKRVTRRERFLKERDAIVPWKEWAALVETKYPASGRVGRQHIGTDAEPDRVHSVHDDTGRGGLDKRGKIVQAQRDGRVPRDVQFHIAQRPAPQPLCSGQPLHHSRTTADAA